MSSDAADEMEDRRYNKLLRRTFGPYRALSVKMHTVTIKEDMIPNIVLIDRLTLSPTRACVTDLAYEMKEIRRPRHRNGCKKTIE